MTTAAPSSTCRCGHGHAEHINENDCLGKGATANPPFHDRDLFYCTCNAFTPEQPKKPTTRFPTVCKTQDCHHGWEDHTGSNPDDVTDTACISTEPKGFEMGLRATLRCTCKQFNSGVGG